MKRITVVSMTVQAVVWLALPTVIWLVSWLRAWIGIPVALAVVVALFLALRGIHDKKEHGGLRDVKVDRRYRMIGIVLLLFVFFSGIGALWYQVSGDSGYRNGIFLLLSKLPWPVNFPAPDGTPSVLSYYIGYWLPAALVSKATGMVVPGDVAQFLYAVWGIFIIFNFIFALFGGKARWLVVALFFLYCGWDVAIYLLVDQTPQSFMEFIYHQKDISTDYYASNAVYTLFTHNYNQAYPAFIGMLLLWRWRQERSSLILVYSLMFISCPFPAAGLLPAVAFWMLKHYSKEEWNWKNWVGIVVFLLESAYFLSNNSAGNPYDSALVPVRNREESALIFITCSYLVYMPWLWRSVRRDAIFWILFVVMAFAPMVALDGKLDFGWRLAIPFAAYFMFRMMRHILRVRDWKRPRNILLAVALAIGAVAPMTYYAQIWLTPFLIKTERIYVLDATTREISGVYSGFDKRQYSPEELHDPNNRCYGNFFADGESFYSRCLMPR